MTSANQKYDALTMRYLDGLCSDEETLSLLSWIAESEANQARFESFKKVWELTAFPMPDILNVDAALASVNAKIDAQEEQAKTVQMPWLKRNYKYVSGIAAALVVALFVGFLVTRTDSTVMMAASDWTHETPYMLPDGTAVSFGGEGQIAYDKHFNQNSRSVDFEGVAYFDVAKDANKPFVIHCGKTDVEVLGTSFLLDARKEAERVTVDLYSGKVRMTCKDKKGNVLSSIEILPSERGLYDITQGELSIMTYPEVKDEELKRDHVLDFNDVSLSTIVETLEYIFEAKIELPQSHANEKLTARFTDKDPVEEVVETIATVFGFEVAKTDGVYVIR